MPEHMTTKINRVLPQQNFEIDQDIEPNAELLREEDGDGLKRQHSGSKNVGGKKKVKM